MTFFRAFPRLSRKPSPVVAENMNLDLWLHIDYSRSSRLVKRVEMCTALAIGRDACGKAHRHTLLRVFLSAHPATPSSPDEVLLIERVLSTDGAYHSVTSISETFSGGGTFFHPNIHDRVCVVYDGPSTALARRLQIERTATFGDGRSRLTVAQFAQILDFVSRTTMLVCAGGDCKFQSRSFVFTCMAALTPSLPPPTLVRKTGDEVGTNGESGEEDDSVFELSAEVFWGQVPWLLRDPVSVKALTLIGSLKEPRYRAKARLYH